MRSKKMLNNTLFSILEEFVLIISAFIIPKLILSKYGSDCNGLISSITQFLSCAILLRSGIGGATRVALYKPLAEKNYDEINSIMKVTDKFMKKIGLILVLLIIFLAFIYPTCINNEFDFIYTFTLILILGFNSFSESFFGITYLILLQADQKLWISSLFKIISQILNVVFSIVLIKLDFSIHLVKLMSTFAFIIYPIGINIYVKKKYKINYYNVCSNENILSQRWDSFWHQVADFVSNNTDVVILSIFTNLSIVSIYSVYILVINALKRFVASFSNGIEAALGNMFAKKEDSILKENVGILEFVFFNLGVFIYSCGILCIRDFIKIYTLGINDANYLVPFFSYILLFSQLFVSFRVPFQQVIQASGYYKETKKYAIIECLLNIGISIITVKKYGLIGIAIGTFIALLYKTLMYSKFVCKNIINISFSNVIFKMIFSVIEVIIILFIYKILPLFTAANYFYWFINSCLAAILSLLIIFIGIAIIYRKEYLIFKMKIINALKKGDIKNE